MHSPINTFELNERLLTTVQTGNFHGVLDCLMEGARATIVSTICGRTAVGTAALVGDAEILELLIQSCEEPDLDIFNRNRSNSFGEMETECTPDGMDNLEWEDEFIENCNDCDQSGAEDVAQDAEDTSLYYYYAKTFERTGAIITRMNEPYAMSPTCGHQQDTHRVDALLMTPLHYAAACGHVECVRILISHGATLDAVNSDGYTPLHVGVAYAEVAHLLLKHGANPNLKTLNTGETPLHLAIRNHSSAVANIILQTNANINETDDIDQTPLMCAIITDLDSVAVTLIERGARINLQDKEGRSALYYAVLQNNVPLTIRLLQRGARRITSHYLLHHCVRHNMSDMAETLISHGDSLNVRNKDGVTPILLAILSQKTDMLELLLRVAAVQQSQGATIVDCVENELLIAVQYIDTVQDFKPIARILFAHSEGRWMSASFTSLSWSCYIPYCQTPLARAVMLNKFDIAEFLVKEGVDIYQVCRDHVVNNLRATSVAGCLEFAKLLVHADFKFPCLRPPFPNNWTTERRHFEMEMFRLCGTPLSLQSLARIVIRNQLISLLNSSVAVRQRYPTTKRESSLRRMINLLGIPKILQKYLFEFDDCASVMKNACNMDGGG
ncbi:poly [ADP-ribose] polymerase tankyrase-1 isoform X1 [Anastrepha obliqua]|uniref:poly [ADP-ribose] polymerase tankyrase-1 isoform X1 n=1 Tax=Anastrepha obliqua TaxID=95512 RepID=UPI00240A08A2|nr:poly [ADP-ribose] polymerase tankyrase-1 isoform X1 [Anastrepha obliqua]